ncbi:MAG TPA: N-acetyl-gamma-glutamyl-phosphate reductase [Gemmatimonadaceae bacterium]|nr:N-acetyl-gamma-glutamyl-phosphate reductase [Gemmatimonadaceae bacterium]
MHKLPIGVLGASGYAGRELCALALRHPRLELAFAAAHERAGERAQVAGRDITFTAADDAPLGDAALVFTALPHGTAAPWVARAHDAGAKVIDLSADLRPGNVTHADIHTDVPYGLTELARDEVRGASIVANPGCYPTAVLLALAPVLTRGLVSEGATINIVAASGVTGAGHSPRADLMFAEVAEDFRPYAAGNTHRHLNEMRAVIKTLGSDADVIFTPHLLPVARGILATITVPVADEMTDPLALWTSHYAGEPFIEIVPDTPRLRDVVHRNTVRIAVMPVQGVRQPTLLIIAALDNLVKGAAGQALQNGNLLLGLEETEGLVA